MKKRRFWSRWDSWLLTTVIGAVGLAVIVALVLTGVVPWFDRWSGLATDSVAHGVVTVLDRITDPWILRGVGVIGAVVQFRRGEHRIALWLLTSVVLSWPIELIFALPSAHAMTSMIVLGAFLVLGQRQPGAPRRRLLAWCLTWGLLIVIGATEILLPDHTPADVLAGWFLGVALLGASALAFGLARPIRRRRAAQGLAVRRKRVGVILNPTKVEDVADFRQQVERLTAEFDWEPPIWFETAADDPGHAMTRAAGAIGVDLVIAAGGDGTVRAVCSELASTEVPLGIVPAGTGNLLVRNLGLPLDQESAIRVALTGRDRRIDLVRVEGDGLSTERFAVMGGLGLDAAIMGGAPDQLKAQVGWAAYLVSAARHLSFPAVRVELTLDNGRTLKRWAQMIVVGNVGTLQAGIPLLPLAAPDDGMLDVVVVAPRRLIDWPVLAWRAIRRSQLRDDRMSHWKGRRVAIRAADPVPRQLDGDVLGPGRELRCEVEPGVLLVRVPSGL